MRKTLGKSFSLLAITSTVMLAGCGSGNYKTDSGHSITMDEVRAYKAHRQMFPLPYRLGEYDYKFADQKQAQSKYMQDYAADIEKSGGKILNQWLEPDSESSLDVSLSIQKSKLTPPFGILFINTFFTAFTLGIIPMIASAKTESDLQLSSNGTVLHKQRASISGSGTVSILVPWGYIFGHDVIGLNDTTEVNKYAPLIAHEEHLVRAISSEKPLYERVKNSRDPQQLATAAQQLKFYKPLVMQNIAKLLAQRKDRLAQYKMYIQQLPEFSAYIPEQDQIYFVGPADFTVLDVIKKSRTSQDKALLATLIKAGGQPYKQFTAEEILRLNKLGLPGEVIQAMQAAGQSHVQPTVQQQGNTAPQPMTNAAPTAVKSGQSSQEPPNKVAECAKALAAKKACEHAPGPFGIGVKICMKGVKDKFGGYGCPFGF